MLFYLFTVVSLALVTVGAYVAARRLPLGEPVLSALLFTGAALGVLATVLAVLMRGQLHRTRLGTICMSVAAILSLGLLLWSRAAH